MAQLTCPNCGAPVIAGMIFCDECGTDLRQAGPIQPAQTMQQAAGLEPESGRCPNCQHVNRPGAVFCENCGTALAAKPAQAVENSNQAGPLPVYQPEVTPAAPRQLNAYLTVQGANTRLDLPSGKTEFIVGREDEISGVYPDINLDPFGAQDAGVSRRHIKLSNAGGNWTAEDLNTVNGTFLNRQRIPPNQPTLLRSGDELRLGKLVISFRQD